MYNDATNDEIALGYVDNIQGIEISFDKQVVQYEFYTNSTTVPQTLVMRLDVSRPDGT